VQNRRFFENGAQNSITDDCTDYETQIDAVCQNMNLNVDSIAV